MSQPGRVPSDPPPPPRSERPRRRRVRRPRPSQLATQRLVLIQFDWQVATGVQPVLYLQRTLLD
jgi:hypothetical protein